MFLDRVHSLFNSIDIVATLQQVHPLNCDGIRKIETK
jgi:hypothetical protein